MTWISCVIVTKKLNARLGLQRNNFSWARVLRTCPWVANISTNVCENPESSLALICICLVACYSYMKFLKLDCWRSIYDQGFIDSKDQRVSYKLTKELFTTLCFFIISSRFQRNLNRQSMGSYRTEKSTGEVLLNPAHSLSFSKGNEHVVRYISGYSYTSLRFMQNKLCLGDF